MSFFSDDDLSKLDNRGPQSGGGAGNWTHYGHDKNTGKDMRHETRLLPLSLTDPYPVLYQRMHFVYGDDYLSGVCPQVHSDGKQFCPFCDIFFTLWNCKELQGDENKTLRKTLQKLGPDQRAYANVYDIAQEKVLTFSISYGARRAIMEVFDEYKDNGILLTDPEEGRNITLTYTRFGKNSRVKSVTPEPNNSAVPLADWHDHLFDLDKMSRQRELVAGDLENILPDVLGDHFELLMELYAKYRSEDDDTIGEEV